MALGTILFIVLSISGVLMVLLHYAYASPLTDAIKIYPNRTKRLSFGHLARNILFNGLCSGGTVIAMSYGMRGLMFAEGETTIVAFLWDVLASLALYDLLYYFMHRFLFHEWKWMRGIHLVHHTNKFPTAFESLYAHPIEIIAGVVLLMSCVAMVGPISLWAFAVVFAVFSFLNLLIHSGLDFRARWLRPIAYLNRKHARHHASMRAGNFSSISPVPDMLFGTAE
ncbi:MAG: sterol desaturase family protein [Myxococcales bacterium]|nr:sterol desaturase family protein [Myxococcales bacterium]